MVLNIGSHLKIKFELFTCGMEDRKSLHELKLNLNYLYGY